MAENKYVTGVKFHPYKRNEGPLRVTFWGTHLVGGDGFNVEHVRIYLMIMMIFFLGIYLDIQIIATFERRYMFQTIVFGMFNLRVRRW